MSYIHQRKAWPRLRWDERQVSARLAEVRHQQGRLLGQMESLGFEIRAQAVLETLTADVVKTSEIEGEKVSLAQARSSLGRRLGIEVAAATADRHVDGLVEMLLDATQHFEDRLTAARLCSWQAALFPTGRSGLSKIQVGRFRTAAAGPMQVISGGFGRERVHFEAPAAARLPAEMKAFLAWFNGNEPLDLVLKAAHFWFVTIHPFEDGNGRVARAIADLLLARSEKSSQRFYSMSSQISAERKAYYAVLEATQKGDLDITGWLMWFLGCLERAIWGAGKIQALVTEKVHFWKEHRHQDFNGRQKKVLNRLLDGLEGNLTSSKWAAMNKCSQDTASRDIEDLIQKKILRKNPGGGRNTSYALG